MMRILVFLFCVVAPHCHGATYYVDPVSGSDTNSGASTNLAWRSIPGTLQTNGSNYLSSAWGSFNSGASKVPGGTTVLVKSGSLFAATNFGPANITRDYWAVS